MEASRSCGSRHNEPAEQRDDLLFGRYRNLNTGEETYVVFADDVTSAPIASVDKQVITNALRDAEGADMAAQITGLAHLFVESGKS